MKAKNNRFLRFVLFLILVLILVFAAIIMLISNMLNDSETIAYSSSVNRELSYSEENLNSVVNNTFEASLGNAVVDSTLSYSVARLDRPEEEGDIYGSFSGPLTLDLKLKGTDTFTQNIIASIAPEDGSGNTLHATAEEFGFSLEPFNQEEFAQKAARLSGSSSIPEYSDALAMAFEDGCTVTDSNISESALSSAQSIAELYGLQLPDINNGYIDIPYSVVYFSDGTLLINLYTGGETIELNGTMNLE